MVHLTTLLNKQCENHPEYFEMQQHFCKIHHPIALRRLREVSIQLSSDLKRCTFFWHKSPEKIKILSELYLFVTKFSKTLVIVKSFLNMSKTQANKLHSICLFSTVLFFLHAVYLPWLQTFSYVQFEWK